jgi:hypothetical protein
MKYDLRKNSRFNILNIDIFSFGQSLQSLTMTKPIT